MFSLSTSESSFDSKKLIDFQLAFPVFKAELLGNVASNVRNNLVGLSFASCWR